MNNYNKLVYYNRRLKELLANIYNIEHDTQLLISDKLSKIKIIEEEIVKIKQEVDIIKKEIIMLKAFNVN